MVYNTNLGLDKFYAPGIDIEKDIVEKMEFEPRISPKLKEMDAKLFRPEPKEELQRYREFP